MFIRSVVICIIPYISTIHMYSLFTCILLRYFVSSRSSIIPLHLALSLQRAPNSAECPTVAQVGLQTQLIERLTEEEEKEAESDELNNGVGKFQFFSSDS